MNVRNRTANRPHHGPNTRRFALIALCSALLSACGDDAAAPGSSPNQPLQDASSAISGPDGALADSGAMNPPPNPGNDASSPRDAALPVDAARDPSLPASGPFPPVSDFAKDGPYTARTLQNVGPSNNYTVYLPTELAPGGAKNPIVGWMSGGGTTHSAYPLLPRLSTHGFVVVAANVVPGIGEEAALGQQIIAGIDWAIAENGRSDSELFDKLKVSRIASMGYSMGSLSTFMIASDPRLTTTVHISGGNMVAERVKNLRAPAAFICGIPGDASCGLLASECDIAAANCDTDFAGAVTPVFYANFTGGHLGILLQPTQDLIGTMATRWLRWKLMDDLTVDPSFVGPQCSYCSDAAFKVQQKGDL